MNTVATRHPALLVREAIDTVTTELVRADVAPTYFAISVHDGERVHVHLNLSTRADFDAATSLFGFTGIRTYEGHDGVMMVRGDGMALGVYVDAGAPAYLGHRFEASTIDNGPECIHCHTFANHAAPGEACRVRDAKALASQTPADCDAASLS